MFMVNVLVQSYTVITLPIYYFIQRPNKTLELASARKSRQVDPEDPYSPWVRIGERPYHVLSVCKTLAEGFEMIRKTYPPDRPAVGYRKIIEEQIVTDHNGKQVRVDGKVLRKYRLTDYQWITYKEVFERSDFIGKGMLVNGLKRKDRIVILAETCADNLIFGISIANIGLVTISVFATLGDDGKSLILS